MAKSAKIAWGIDVGNCSLKALKIAASSEGVEVLDFAVIEHEKILSQPDIEPEQRREMIVKALSDFISEHDIGKIPVVVSVPGQSSFARFIKLPPVEPKRIPEIVRYEAIQQIPFDINDVEWDWQAFTAANSPEVEVGIFAMKRELVSQALEPFFLAKCPVSQVQMAPMALYNFFTYDQKQKKLSAGKEANILLDIGAENTDLVIADGQRVWQRSIPIGGNQFTAAVQKAFKLGFTKAEGIKRTANTSKYARQIFQAMRSVFADLAAEIQRSLGFYSSSNRDVQFREALALGSALKLPGLSKFLQQSLSLPIKRLDSFESVKLSPDVSMSQFSENLSALGVAYGLALQGIGRVSIESNLLPTDIARRGIWQQKKRMIVAACGIFAAASLLNLFQAFSVSSSIGSKDTGTNKSQISTITAGLNSRSSEKSKFEKDISTAQDEITKCAQFYQNRDLNQEALDAIIMCLPNEKNTPDQADLYKAYVGGDKKTLLETPRNERKQVFINKLHLFYVDDITKDINLAFPGSDSSRAPTVSSRVNASVEEEGGRRGSAEGRPSSAGGGGRSSQQAMPKKDDGFVVLIEGTTPHKDNLQFLFTPGVENQRDKWGFFNRLRYMGKTNEKITEELQQQQTQASKPDEPAATTGRTRRDRSLKPKPAPKVSSEPNEPADSSSVVETAADAPDGTPAKKSWDSILQELPLETYFDPAANTEAYFDTSRKGFLEAFPVGDQPDPAFLGLYQQVILDEDTATGKALTIDLYLDPMTREPITASPKLINDNKEVVKNPETSEPVIEKRDYWFQIRFKLKIKSSEPADEV